MITVTRFKKIMRQCEKLFLQRRKLYGNTSIELISFTTTIELVMMKLSRILSLRKINEKHIKIEDELLDAINYLNFALQKYKSDKQ